MMDGGNEEVKGKLEHLEKRVQELLKSSHNIEFTRYLQNMTERIRSERHQLALLEDELERNCRYYAALNTPPMPEPKMEPEAVPTPMSETVTRPDQTAVPNRSAQQIPPPPAQVVYTAPAKQNRKSAEYSIGAFVLCAVGGAFILAALVMLGQILMSSLLKGIAFYGVSLLVLVLAEGILYRKWKALGVIFSALSIGGLYLSTVVNYFFFHNFDVAVAAGILILTSLLTLFISRKRRSAWYRIVGLISCYLCIIPAGVGLTEGAFFVLMGMLLFLNITYIFVPLGKNELAMNVVHMLTSTFFTSILTECNPVSSGLAGIISGIVIMQLILVKQLHVQSNMERAESRKMSSAGIFVAYGISIFIYAVLLVGQTDSVTAVPFLSSILFITAAWILSFILLIHREDKWYLLNSYAIFVIVLCGLGAVPYASAVGLVALLLLVKVAGIWGKQKLRVCDAGILTMICIKAFAGGICSSCMDRTESLIIWAGMLLGLVALQTWKAYAETILTFTFAFILAVRMPETLAIPVFAGILLAGVLLFNNVKRWKSSAAVVYNILVLVGMLCLLVPASIFPVYRNSLITYICLLVFGLASIVLILREKYGLETRYRTLIAAIFLTYMAFILQTDYSFVNSILLMLTALVSVAVGFAEEWKPTRIYGVVLALLVCGKIALYDFWSVPSLQKTFLFFGVGVMALVIAILYMVLEKRQENNKEATQDREGSAYE